jgi:type II secretory pathway pseudopilin PulG
MVNMKTEKGMATLELLIALAIFIMSMTAILMVSFGNRSINVDSRVNQNALYKVRHELEDMRALTKGDFASVKFSTSSDGIYKIEKNVFDLTQCAKLLVASIDWSVSPSRQQKLQLKTAVTNWELPALLKDSCGASGPAGNWNNPGTLFSADLGPGNEARAVDVVNKIIFLGARASDDKKSDLFVYDFTDPENPSVLDDVNIDPKDCSSDCSGINDIDVAGDFAFVATNHATGQLLVMDVSDPSSVTSTREYDLSNETSSSTVALSIYYLDDELFLGTDEISDGDEFFIFDVSDPENGIDLLDSFELGADVNDIYVDPLARVAYVALSDTANDLVALDVSDSESISKLGSFNGEGTKKAGKSVFGIGQKLYLGRYLKLGNSSDPDLYVLNVADPGSIESLGSLSLDSAPDINSIWVVGKFGFLGTSDANEEFQIWDISDPSNIEQISSCGSYNFPQQVAGLDYEDDYVYAAVRSQNALRVLYSQTNSC